AEVLLHGGEAQVERQAILLRRRRRDEHREHLALLLVLPRGGVRLLEDDRRVLAGLRQRHELLEQRDDLRILRGDLERPLRGGERLGRLLQRTEVQARELELARDAAGALL